MSIHSKERACKNCSTNFIPKPYGKPRRTPVFCTKKCAQIYLTKTKRKYTCNQCGMDFESNLKGPIPKFCSNICINRFSYSKDIIGKCPVCGDNLLGSFGRAHKKSCCSRKCAGKYKTLVEVPKGYRRIIFRHKIINNLEIGCEHCKILDIDLLVVHHIDRDRKNNDINNLSLLCANCHKKEHHEDSQEMREYIKKLRDAKDAFAERFQQIRDIQ